MSQVNRLLLRAKVKVLNDCFLFFLGQCAKQKSSRDGRAKSTIVRSNVVRRSKRPPLESKRTRR